MWQPIDHAQQWRSAGLELTLNPARGLVGVRIGSNDLVLPHILGVEIVRAAGLSPRPWVEEGMPPEVVCRQDTVLVISRPTAARPVECHARWRIIPPDTFDLQVSTLTPGRWNGLSVRTSSLLPEGSTQRASSDASLMVLHRFATGDVSYAEMCHPQDGIGVEINKNAVHFHLFGHDLEKGVILRGRLRGIILPRQEDESLAHSSYERFIREPPNLSL
jgi:hypothetical protein